MINLLFKKSKEVKEIVDPYTWLAVTNKLNNFRIFTADTLLSSPVLKRHIDIPSFVFDFIMEEGKCLGIANILCGEVLGITFRSMRTKKFISYHKVRSIPLGLGELPSSFKYSDPIIMVEGPKDLYSLKPFCANVMATQTAGLSKSILELLKGLTDRVILLSDNDEAGRKALKSDLYHLKELNISAYPIEHPQGVKDCGEIADLSFRGNLYDASYLSTYYANAVSSIV